MLDAKSPVEDSQADDWKVFRFAPYAIEVLVCRKSVAYFGFF